eukprot:COSAG04_NODE_2379_length_4241_cov_1.984307_6_plen_28_part_01
MRCVAHFLCQLAFLFLRVAFPAMMATDP